MRLHERIAKLLAKAEATDNLDEAAAYVAKAQQLATLYAIDLSSLARAPSAHPAKATHRTQTIGKLRARSNRQLILLYLAVAQSNNVQLDVAANSTYVIAYGMPSDLDVVEQLWSSLAVQMAGAVTDFLRSGAWRHEGLTAQQARATFQQHFIARIGQRLVEARSEAAADYDAEHADGAGALVLLDSAREAVSQYHDDVSRARGTWGGYSGSLGSSRSAPARAGRAAADRARISSPRRIGGNKPAVGD